jgi:hypothetical protein
MSGEGRPTGRPSPHQPFQKRRLSVTAQVRGSPGTPWIELVDPRLSKMSE